MIGDIRYCKKCGSKFVRETEKQQKCSPCLIARAKQNANKQNSRRSRVSNIPGTGENVTVIHDPSGDFDIGSEFPVFQFGIGIIDKVWPIGMTVGRGDVKMIISDKGELKILTETG